MTLAVALTVPVPTWQPESGWAAGVSLMHWLPSVALIAVLASSPGGRAMVSACGESPLLLLNDRFRSRFEVEPAGVLLPAVSIVVPLY